MQSIVATAGRCKTFGTNSLQLALKTYREDNERQTGSGVAKRDYVADFTSMIHSNMRKADTQQRGT